MMTCTLTKDERREIKLFPPFLGGIYQPASPGKRSAAGGTDK
jgi:hypothetical protein